MVSEQKLKTAGWQVSPVEWAKEWMNLGGYSILVAYHPLANFSLERIDASSPRHAEVLAKAGGVKVMADKQQPVYMLSGHGQEFGCMYGIEDFKGMAEEAIKHYMVRLMQKILVPYHGISDDL